MTASILTVDFSKVPDIVQQSSGNPQDYKPTRETPRTADGKLLTPKQIRARARRRIKRNEVVSDEELDYLYRKPIEEWDLEELAKGRPRNAKGHFKGPAPSWVSSTVHEEAMTRYTAAVKSDMRSTTVDALTVLKQIITNEDTDEKGKPFVPASTKLDAAKFLLEHVVGKPTQRIESDISVKLQGILGQVMVNPSQMAEGGMGYTPSHFPGITMDMAVAREENEDDQLLFG